ncbi:ABC transporter substrate-binding protein [Glycomyces buryatensis]|uniref:ABC transporter substrate-binding protein n=1 Tax=Glycomyces buryatensis TaxID=2570927 RepID=A0A4S8PZC4_9ACTN|nr:ABC transporter substrate-binding protein [Glycomyces buryatensis]THV33609.1 ABC transporter substrate-binding protein [Glycomyces buryatensis]
MSSIPLHLNRRGLLAAGGALASGGLLAACGDGTEDGETADLAWSFTDDRDQTVDLDSQPQSIVAFTGLAAALYDYGVTVDGVFGPTVTADGSPDIQAGRMPVDGLTIIGNAWGEFDIEKFASVAPEILVSHFYAGFPLWFVPEERTEEVEQLAPTIGIEVSNGTLDEVIGRHTEIAVALGADIESQEVVEAQDRYEAAGQALQEAAAQRPLKVMPVNAYPEVFYVGYLPKFTDLSMAAELGVQFVEAEEPNEDGYWEELSWENADKYEADVILLDARAGNLQPEDLTEFPTWNALPAVKAGQVYSWNPEPIYSHLGGAEALEILTEAVTNSEPLS